MHFDKQTFLSKFICTTHMPMQCTCNSFLPPQELADFSALTGSASSSVQGRTSLVLSSC